jgi:pyridoxamine 5'-phosphate oxidase
VPDTREDRSLADPLPADPLPLVREWLDDAVRRELRRNPTAMTLATVEPGGDPSARIVICRGWDLERGYFVFYTDRSSPKGDALEAHARAACVFHWDAVERQIRITGPVTLSPDEESDAYFSTRPLEAQIAASASLQSRPVDSREALLKGIRELATAHGLSPDEPVGGPLPRPERWGGYRVWAEQIELWVGRPGRVHDRGLWVRELKRQGDGFEPGPWSVERLQP